jgi:hypothetical protein
MAIRICLDTGSSPPFAAGAAGFCASCTRSRVDAIATLKHHHDCGNTAVLHGAVEQSFDLRAIKVPSRRFKRYRQLRAHGLGIEPQLLPCALILLPDKQCREGQQHRGRGNDDADRDQRGNRAVRAGHAFQGRIR